MYAAHTAEDKRIQSLYDHLTGVARLAGQFAEIFGAKELGELIGRSHDIGKYSQAFQDRLFRGGPKVDHSTAGGLEIYKLFGPASAYAVFGHHGGLQDGGTSADIGGDATLYGRLKKTGIPDYSAFASEITLSRPAEPKFSPLYEYGFSMAFLIRMLFSCLVDADFLDTEAFVQNGAVKRGGYDSIETLAGRLTDHIRQFENPVSEINRKRTEILHTCIERAADEKGLFSLTVPTGGGKTIASLAFALLHARQHGMDRVIFVIPYTNIIEQSVDVFSKILGAENVLAHYANVGYDDRDELQQKKQLSTENWDAPVIVTTNVQFFESLYASRSSRCRKLHNIANSVIIFDEAQMLPLSYLMPCVRAIEELVHNYGASCVLCSATQPALSAFFSAHKPSELMKDTKGLYQFFKRTIIRQLGPVDDGALADRLRAHEQVLCIVSTRAQAQNVYALLAGEEGVYHLSTMMYPEHRRAVLAEIRERLDPDTPLPCRVVATSLVEAGVDLDFPAVYRAKAGLDSIVQAAGRCNREGRRSAGESIVYVFEPDGRYRLPISAKQFAAVYDAVAPHHEDLGALEAVSEYFEALYHIKGDGLDKLQITRRFEEGIRKGMSFPFASVAAEFHVIDDATRAVLIPRDEKAREYAARLRAGERSRELMRGIGNYSVNVYEHQFKDMLGMGAIETIDEEIAILADLSGYSDETGLAGRYEGGKGIMI